MRKTLLGASALVSVTLLASSAEAKPSYIPVAPPAGAVTTTAFGINDDNIVAGSYTDSAGIQHGYYGPPDGSNYTTFDIPNVTGTQPRAIFNDGSITGLALVSGFAFGEEFYRSPSGDIKITKNNGTIFDGVAQGGNDSGLYVGDYLDQTGTRVGWEGKAGKYKSAFKLKGVDLTSTNPRQINNHGVVAGSYIDTAGIQHGFVLDGKKFTSFDFPGSAGVTASEGINDDGQVSGLWQDSAGNRHGFLFDYTTGKFKQIGPDDGSTFQEAWGLNNKGLIAGDTSDGVAWIYCPLKPKKCPKGGAAALLHPGHAQAFKRPVNLP
jgi:uncharacterized membrane protein